MPHAFVAAVLQNQQLYLFHIEIRILNQKPAQATINLFRAFTTGIPQDDINKRFIISGITEQVAELNVLKGASFHIQIVTIADN